jgi:hypothetical protein
MNHHTNGPRDAIVLAAIVGAVERGTFGGKPVKKVRHEGRCGIQMIQARLAKGLDVSEHQVKRALECLRDKELIWTHQTLIGLRVRRGTAEASEIEG